MVTAIRTTTTVLALRPGVRAGIALDALAREAGLHPDVVRAFVRLGLLGPGPRYPRDAAARLARAGRLRRDLGLNYAGAVLASDLLARIETLEARLAPYDPAR